MAENTAMVDVAMDIDYDKPAPPSTGDNSAADFRTPLRSRRSPGNGNKKQGRNDILKHRSDAKVQKSSSKPRKVADRSKATNLITNVDYRTPDASSRKRMIRIQHAICNGSFELRRFEDGSPVLDDEGNPEHLQRLNVEIVARALNEPLPGLTFDSALTSFTEEDLADLVQALEALQVDLAHDGQVFLADNAGKVLREFAREVMLAVLGVGNAKRKRGLYQTDDDNFWVAVRQGFGRAKDIRWYTHHAIRIIGGAHVDTFPRWGDRRVMFKTRMAVIVEALTSSDKHPMIAEAIKEVEDDIPNFVMPRYTTMRSLVVHFESARSRYLANLNASGGSPNQNNLITPKAMQHLDMQTQNNEHHDSSDDEDDGAPDRFKESSSEDSGQVEEEVPSPQTSFLLNRLDNWMRFKKRQQQADVDTDMLSGLELGDLKWGI